MHIFTKAFGRINLTKLEKNPKKIGHFEKLKKICF